MFNDLEMPPPIYLGKVFKNAFKTYQEHFSSFISLGLVYALMSSVVRISLKKFFGENLEVIFAAVIINTIILSRIGVVLLYMAAQSFLKEPVDTQKAFLKTQELYGTYLFVYSAVLLLMGIGFFFFIVPGFVLGAMFLFADALVVVEKKSFKDAFLRSRELTRKYFSVALLFLLVIIMISLFPVILLKFLGAAHLNTIKSFSDIFSAIFIPFYIIAQIELCYQIKQTVAIVETE